MHYSQSAKAAASLLVLVCTGNNDCMNENKNKNKKGRELFVNDESIFLFRAHYYENHRNYIFTLVTKTSNFCPSW